MKKLAAILLSCTLLLGLSACNKNNESTSANQSQPAVSASVSSSQPESAAPSSEHEIVEIKEQVLLEQNNIKVVVTSIDYDDIMGVALLLSIDNQGDTGVTLQAKDVLINGLPIRPIFSVDVPAKSKEEAPLTIMSVDLEDQNIETLETLQLGFIVLDIENWELVFESEPVTVPLA